MRVSFSSVTTARAARDVLEAYGYRAEQVGRQVVTDCPTLLAVPAIERQVGLAAVEHLDLSGGSRLEDAAPTACPSAPPRELTV